MSKTYGGLATRSQGRTRREVVNGSKKAKVSPDRGGPGCSQERHEIVEGEPDQGLAENSEKKKERKARARQFGRE